jgi:hypothetical protein
MKHTNLSKKIILAAICIGLMVIAAAKSDVPSTGFSLSTNIKTPKGTTYKRGESLPFVIEIRNLGVFPVPYNQINGMNSFRITDRNGNSLGEGGLDNQISPWEYADGNILPGEIISVTFYLERFRFKTAEELPSNISIQFSLPIQTYGREKQPVIKYTNGVGIQLKDSPFEHLLTSEDLPEQWSDDLDITYQEGGGIYFRYSAIHIDGQGKLTTIGMDKLNKNPAIKNGRHEYIMEPNELDNLLRELREFKIEKLNEYDTDKSSPDAVYSSITIAKGGNVFCGRYGGNKPASDLRRIMLSIVDGNIPDDNTERRGRRSREH